MKRTIAFLSVLIMGCSGEDACFSKKGDPVAQTYGLAGFHTLDIPMNVSVEIIPDTIYALEIHSFENRIEALSFNVTDSVLVIKNEISCEMLKSYETAVLKIHSPNLKRINSRTQFRVFSTQTLRFPNLYLLTSIPNETSASTSFDLKIDNNSIVVEDNQVGFFQLKGKTKLLDVQLYGANGVVKARELEARNIKLYHRSNQNIELFPVSKIEGTLFSVGNAYLYHKPDTVNITKLYTGSVYYK